MILHGSDSVRETDAKGRRVVVVIRRFWPLVGGAENAAANLAAGLASRGWDVVVLTPCWHPQWPALFAFRGYRVVRLPHAPTDRWNTFRYVQALVRWLRRNRDDYDLVYVSQLKWEAYAAIRAVGRCNPVVLRAESSGPEGDRRWQQASCIGKRVRRACLRSPAVVAPSQTIERDLQAAGYSRPPLERVARGVPIPPARPPIAKIAAREAIAAANASLQIPPDGQLAVYTGRLELARGLPRLIAAWASIVQRWPKARLWIAGAGPDERAVREHIEARGLTGRVVLTGVFDDVHDLLTAADLFVLPSKESGAPAALLEAMAAGLPIVASNVAEHRELAADGVDALLVPHDAGALATTLDRVLDDPALACQLGAAAAERAKSRFSLDRMVDDHVALFDRVFNRRETSLPIHVQ